MHGEFQLSTRPRVLLDRLISAAGDGKPPIVEVPVGVVCHAYAGQLDLRDLDMATALAIGRQLFRHRRCRHVVLQWVLGCAVVSRKQALAVAFPDRSTDVIAREVVRAQGGSVMDTEVDVRIALLDQWARKAAALGRHPTEEELRTLWVFEQFFDCGFALKTLGSAEMAAS